MDSLLKGIPCITPFFYDILIVVPTSSEFDAHLHTGALTIPDHWLEGKGGGMPPEGATHRLSVIRHRC